MLARILANPDRRRGRVAGVNATGAQGICYHETAEAYIGWWTGAEASARRGMRLRSPCHRGRKTSPSARIKWPRGDRNCRGRCQLRVAGYRRWETPAKVDLLGRAMRFSRRSQANDQRTMASGRVLMAFDTFAPKAADSLASVSIHKPRWRAPCSSSTPECRTRFEAKTSPWTVRPQRRGTVAIRPYPPSASGSATRT